MYGKYLKGVFIIVLFIIIITRVGESLYEKNKIDSALQKQISLYEKKYKQLNFNYRKLCEDINQETCIILD